MPRVRSPEKKEVFLNAALKLFVAQGVQNTTTAEIAREAGTAAGTLFLYFATKQDLIDELLLKIGKEQSEYINSLLAPTLSARDTFLTIWNGSIGWFIEHMDAYHYQQQVRVSEMVPEAVIQKSNMYFAYYYAAIQKGLAENAIQPYPVELIGGILYQDVVAVMNLIHTRQDAQWQQETARQGFDIFWDGIKK